MCSGGGDSKKLVAVRIMCGRVVALKVAVNSIMCLFGDRRRGADTIVCGWGAKMAQRYIYVLLGGLQKRTYRARVDGKRD